MAIYSLYKYHRSMQIEELLVEFCGGKNYQSGKWERGCWIILLYAFFFNKLVDIFKNVRKKVKEGKKQNKIDDVRNNFRCCENLMKDLAKKGAYAFCCILQIVGGGAAYPNY